MIRFIRFRWFLLTDRGRYLCLFASASASAAAKGGILSFWSALHGMALHGICVCISVSEWEAYLSGHKEAVEIVKM